MKYISLEKSILNAAASHEIEGQKLSLAVSGGPDSMAMAHALINHQKEMDSDIEILHFNHLIRGEAAKADSEFVRTYFNSIGIPTHISEKNVIALAKKNKMSLEEAARSARYEFFANHIHQKDNSSILTLGHTFNDQVETILMHIIRGSGLNGLQGMATMSHQSVEGQNLTVFRPMLSINRTSVIEYCKDNNIPWRADQTNSSKEYTRNSIRLELLPFLEKYNSGIFRSIDKLGHSAKRDNDYLRLKVNEIWPSIVTTLNDEIRIKVNSFKKLHPSLKWRILQKAAQMATGVQQDLFYKHVESMLNIAEGKTGKSLNLPGEIIVAKDYEELLIFKATADSSKFVTLNPPALIKTPGTTLTEHWKILASFESDGDFPHTESIHKNDLSVSLNINMKNEQLWLRSRKNGDIFQPSGMNNYKKLQDFMVDSKIPRRNRDSIPLIVSQKGIAAVVGWRISEWAKPTDNGNSLKLIFKPNFS